MAEAKKVKITELPELTNITLDSEYLPVSAGGMTKRVNIKSIIDKSKDSFRVLGDDNIEYRVSVLNGELKVVPEEVYSKDDAVEGENVLYDGLIINQMYGGGTETETTPVSHSFIELYNFRKEPVNLKGLYLWYRAKAGSWESLPLQGIVPSKHSFLIRCGQHMDFYADGVRCNITDYDMSWDKKLVNKGFSVYLCIGKDTPEDNPVRQIKDALGNVTSTNGRYIDLLGAGGKNEDETIWAYETRYIHCMDKNTAIHRVDFANSSLDKTKNIGSNALVKGNNEADCEPLDYRTCNVEIYRPRCVKDGRWTEFYDKPKQTATTPSMVNVCYGQEGSHTRTFTFQTPLVEDGFVKYRKEGETVWTTVETETEIASHIDGDTTVHRAIVHNIPVGKYEYMVGTEGCSSDTFSFEIKEYTKDTPINFLWTSDQQSWTKREYDVWKVCSKVLNPKAPQFDFHLNTGDISQNANRTFEWKYYYDYAKDITRNIPHIITCGNNDLVNKKYSDAFNYYITSEGKHSNSVYWFDLGYVHFVSLNSNEDMTYVNGGSIGGYNDSNEYLQAQADWLDSHLIEVEARETKPRWIVVFAHLGPFTVGRTKRLQRWISVVEKHKVDLFLCGHNHAYSRSKSLYTGYDYNSSPAYNDYSTKKEGTSELLIVDEFKADGVMEINREEDLANGTVYILNHACGFKLSGKEKPITLPSSLIGTKHDNGNSQPWWIAFQQLPTNPCYATLNITYDKIEFKEISIKGIVGYDEYKNTLINEDLSKVTEEVIDSLTINYSDRNK